MNHPVLYLGPEGTHSHEAAMRVFTAESSGAVHAGRFRPVRRLALPATESG